MSIITIRIRIWLSRLQIPFFQGQSVYIDLPEVLNPIFVVLLGEGKVGGVAEVGLVQQFMDLLEDVGELDVGGVGFGVEQGMADVALILVHVCVQEGLIFFAL